MNYYIVTTAVFETLQVSNIRFAHKSQDGSKWVVTTTDTVDNTIEFFNSIPDLSTYTHTNHSDWTGDGGGIDVEDIEETEYLSGL